MDSELRRANEADTWIYFAPVGEGGLAKYAVHQAAALSDAGIDIVFLGREHLRATLKAISPRVEFVALDERAASNRNRIMKAIRWIQRLRDEVSQLVAVSNERGASCILFASYAEYFSPFWVRPLMKLRDRGVRLGTIVHDPIRDFRIGPKIWHEHCVSEAYSFVDVAFVHDDTPLDRGHPKRSFRTEFIEMGTFDVPDRSTAATRGEMRDLIGIPTDAKVLLSFGHIRDGKNIDLLIESIVHFPHLHLLVVGREQSSSQRSVEDYRKLATRCGVADRCHWVNEFVAEHEIYRYFHAADFISLLYSADFRSASGVLALASQFPLPVLASSGGGPLGQCVENYGLGVLIPPDDRDAVQHGLGQLAHHHERLSRNARWKSFREAHSWQRNAEHVIECLRQSN